jgi:hypothetical protein
MDIEKILDIQTDLDRRISELPDAEQRRIRWRLFTSLVEELPDYGYDAAAMHQAINDLVEEPVEDEDEGAAP